MSDLTARTLDETFRERTDALPPADFSAERVARAARRQQQRHRAYGALGGVAAAALVVFLALQSGQVTTAPPVPAATPNPLETSLTIDQAARANASHAWALSLPAGPPEQRDLGYEVARRGDRVAVILDRGEALLPRDVRAVSSPTKVADGWLFIGHGTEPGGEQSIAMLGSTVVHVGEDLTVRTVLEADVVGSLFPSPDRRRAAVVTGTWSGADQLEYDTAHFVTLASGDAVEVPLPDPDSAAVATWDGDRVAFVGGVGGPSSSRFHVYDLAGGRWWVEHASSVIGGGRTVNLVAAPAAQGGSTDRSLVVLNADAQACIHLMEGSRVGEEQLACASADAELTARVSPDGRYALLGRGWTGRVHAGPPARVIDLATGRDVTGLPPQALDVGASALIWETDHTLIGQATRATPVHDSATLFRWDLAASSGQSLGWDPGAGPMPHVDGEEPPPIL